MTIRLNGSTSGYVEIDAPATAGSNTLVLPTGNGTSGQVLSTNGSGALSFVDRMTAAGPAFSAYIATAQTLTNAVFTKIAADTEEYDTASCYDTATYRFTPNVAGYYSCNIHGRMAASTSLTRSIFVFYKNGTNRGRVHDNALTFGTSIPFFSGIDLIYLNGSTDYIEPYIYVTGTGTLTAGDTADQNTLYVQAFLARPA